eukprot:COSAG02_NODE_31314_length_535_cov_4.000000_1_plen_44_part_10
MRWSSQTQSEGHFKYRVDRFLTAAAAPAPELYSQFRQQVDARCD